MVQISRGVHFTSLHAILGGITGLLLITTPFAGLNIRKVKNKKRMKLIHKSSGYITLLMMAVTVYSGLLFTGIISRASGERNHRDRQRHGNGSRGGKLSNLRQCQPSPGV